MMMMRCAVCCVYTALPGTPAAGDLPAFLCILVCSTVDYVICSDFFEFVLDFDCRQAIKHLVVSIGAQQYYHKTSARQPTVTQCRQDDSEVPKYFSRQPVV